MEIVLVVVTLIALTVAAGSIHWAFRRSSGRVAVFEEKELLERVTSEMRVQMGQLAGEALAVNNEQFLALAEQRFQNQQERTKNLLDPFGIQMKSLGETVGKLRAAHEQDKGAVEKMTDEMTRQIGQLSNSTASLTEALRSPTARGAWGENQLRNVIELAGMEAYCDYEEQTVGENREGISGRPDVRVRMPNGAHLAVDAKVPLAAYLDAQAAAEQSEVERHLARHAASLRSHVISLSSKRYWEQNDGPAPEFVVLFVPGESFLADALRADAGLLQEAMEKRVLLASPVNLLALLWAVAKGWQEATIAESAREIADLGADLYSRMSKVLEHLAKTGRGLDQAISSYNDLVGSVEGRLLVTLRRFPELAGGTGDLEAPSEVESSARSLQRSEAEEVEA